MQRKSNRGRYTDHRVWRHSIRTNQRLPPPSPHFLQAGCPSCRPTNSVEALKLVLLTKKFTDSNERREFVKNTTRIWANVHVMAAQPNIGGALCSMPQSLANAHYWSTVQQRFQEAKPVEISWGAPKYRIQS